MSTESPGKVLGGRDGVEQPRERERGHKGPGIVVLRVECGISNPIFERHFALTR